MKKPADKNRGDGEKTLARKTAVGFSYELGFLPHLALGHPKMEIEGASVPQSRCDAPYSPRLVGYRELGASSAPPSSAPSVRLGESRRVSASLGELTELGARSRDARVTWASQDEVSRAKGGVHLSRFERSRLYHVHRAESTR